MQDLQGDGTGQGQQEAAVGQISAQQGVVIDIPLRGRLRTRHCAIPRPELRITGA
ncbi:hypothetical protein ABZV91_17760 [Nocardia sp. NPDC004568]|uniref:hypothetical protein n=1 Tax=Nocardia sp. NPDC004568 TaxID=3154551 RepID=UPI0033BCD266